MEPSIERDSQCFCCGKGNEQGLHLVFAYPKEGEAEASLVVPGHFSGWKDITHGGFLSMLLDEAMAHSCLGIAESAVTAEMTVRFLKPVATGSRVRIVGKAEEVRGRVIRTSARILDEAGTSCAEASARFLRMKAPSA